MAGLPADAADASRRLTLDWSPAPPGDAFDEMVAQFYATAVALCDGDVVARTLAPAALVNAAALALLHAIPVDQRQATLLRLQRAFVQATLDRGNAELIEAVRRAGPGRPPDTATAAIRPRLFA